MTRSVVPGGFHVLEALPMEARTRNQRLTAAPAAPSARVARQPSAWLWRAWQVLRIGLTCARLNEQRVSRAAPRRFQWVGRRAFARWLSSRFGSPAAAHARRARTVP